MEFDDLGIEFTSEVRPMELNLPPVEEAVKTLPQAVPEPEDNIADEPEPPKPETPKPVVLSVPKPPPQPVKIQKPPVEVPLVVEQPKPVDPPKVVHSSENWGKNLLYAALGGIVALVFADA